MAFPYGKGAKLESLGLEWQGIGRDSKSDL